MRTVRVRESIATSPDGAYEALLGLGTDWRVPFRGHAVRWTQRWEPAPDRRTVSFAQVDGDFREFTGRWRISPVDGGCEVSFEASYDVGVPIYDRILDPIVEKVLASYVRSVIVKL
ncbi:SRPBCC family protein [Micromonospora sp. WMMD1102]|uniref:SRPBCC family protein n=1 Tax=Micromonospora sp. WMMD1102 TaxID=3016105 RepID=UPI002414FBDF|nr:SRPBCC family protein [Micromonospora sp. WMMD1102]MDG4785132.1 SRPBCC family protein [Micromonospora sp. WMMD1102]